MPYDEALAERVRAALASRPQGACSCPVAGHEREPEAIEERRMFGGISFMLRGNFCCGVSDERLVVRVGPDAYDDALAEAHVTEMDFTGRPMRGWVFVHRPAVDTDEALEDWVGRGVRFTLTLPAK